jgi:hypothetical protein
MDEDKEILLKAVKMAYRKHVIDDPDVGWNELSEKLHRALRDVMGREAFDKWAEGFRDDVSAAEM